MTTLRPLVIAALLLAALTADAAHPPNGIPSDACRRHLMRADHLRQLYAAGAGMQLRVPPVPEVMEGLTAARVYEAAWRKLAAHGLHDTDTPQWLHLYLNVGARQFAIFLSLRRWTDDLGYGLPGEMTVWGLGGGGYHGGSTERVIAQVLRHMDDFIELYGQAQWACRK